MESKKKLFIFSEFYPYGTYHELFMEKEVKELSKYYDLIVCSQHKHENQKKLPASVTHVHVGNEIEPFNYTEFIATAFQILFYEIKFNINWFAFLLRFRFFLSEIKLSLIRSKRLFKVLCDLNYSRQNDIIYCSWMQQSALSMAILEKSNKIEPFFIRLHGYDLFDYRRKYHYMPYRGFIWSSCHRIMVLSQSGVDYLKSLPIGNREKLVLTFSGLYDNGQNGAAHLTENQKRLVFVSCSRMDPAKGIHRIPQILNKIHYPVHWIHFGGDNDDYELEVRALCQKLPKHISYEFKGTVSNGEILEFYQDYHVDLFIQLSESEGLGMTAVEAMSFGIPSIGLNVGGVSEVINKNTGVLFPADTEDVTIIDFLLSFPKSQFLTDEYRKGVRSYFLQNFDASKNYLKYVKVFESDI